DPPPAFESVEAGVAARRRRHATVGPHHGPDRQSLAAADLEVDGGVARGGPDDARAALRVDPGAGPPPAPDAPLPGRNVELPVDVLRVAPVSGMHGQPGVAQLGLRTDGAERERTVLDVDEVGVALLSLHFEVGEHGLAARAPVHDVVVAIDQPLFPEPN